MRSKSPPCSTEHVLGLGLNWDSDPCRDSSIGCDKVMTPNQRRRMIERPSRQNQLNAMSRAGGRRFYRLSWLGSCIMEPKMKPKKTEPSPNPRAIPGNNQPPESSIARRLNGLERAINRYDEMRNDNLRQSVAEAAKIAFEIRLGGPRAWVSFVKEPRWGAHPPPADDFQNTMHHVFRWMFGVTGGAAKNASFYHRAIKTLIAEGIDVEEFEEQILRRTFKKLAAAHASSKRENRKLFLNGNPPSASARRAKDADAYRISVAKNAAKKRSDYNGPIRAEFTGNTQTFLGLETNKDFVLCGKILAVGDLFKIVINSAYLDPTPGA